MKQELFESGRYFTLFDILVSHGQLLLRSQKNKEDDFNIDIIFFGTSYIQIFSRLNGIRISKVENADCDIEYRTVKKFLTYDNNNFFEIESSGEKFYIAAAFVRVFMNRLEFSESSLVIEKGRETQIATSLPD